MATILEFRSTLRPPGPADVVVSERAAEVVLFPGVRYERLEEAQQACQRRAPRKGPRDQLELEE
jgi:hypothetical protein